MTAVHLLGTGDAFGSGGRLQSCTLVESERGRVLVDCGLQQERDLASRKV